MNVMYIKFILCFGYGIYFTKADILKTSWSPTSGKVLRGQSWWFECEVPSTSSSILWYKRVEDLITKIGFDDVNNDKEFYSSSQYILDKETTSNVTKYTLRLIGAKPEDSGIYQCVSESSKWSSTFIICGDIDKSYCDCMVEQGWANPECFSNFQDEAEGIQDEYKSTLIGLLIALGVVSFYDILIIIIYGRDFFMLIHRRRQLKKMNKQALRNKNSSRKAGSVFDERGNSDKTRLDPKNSIGEGQSESSGYSGSQMSNESDVKKDKQLIVEDDFIPTHATNKAFEASVDDEAHYNLVEAHQSDIPSKWNPSKDKHIPEILTLSGNLKLEDGGTMV